jgi:hypothetical protein
VVPANGTRRKHRHHNLYLLVELNKLEVGRVVKSLVADDLLQERGQLNRLILVWFWQIYVL